MVSAIIVAAGNSRRMGFDKLMAHLNSRPVIEHSINAFLQCHEISEVIVVTSPEREQEININNSRLHFVKGGKDRHDSVAKGLSMVSPGSSYIAVHDGARPLISEKQILRTIQAAKKHQAATSARRVTETVKRSDENQFVTAAVDRENLWLMETPQIFQTEILKHAYAEIHQSGDLVTDEVSALECIGQSTYLVENTCACPNLKITYPQDLELAEIYIKKKA